MLQAYHIFTIFSLFFHYFFPWRLANGTTVTGGTTVTNGTSVTTVTNPNEPSRIWKGLGNS